MGGINSNQVQYLAQSLSAFVGARLQDIQLSGDLILLGFYRQGMSWWGVDLSPRAPQIVLLSDVRPLGLKNEKKPLGLFLKAHFLDHRLTGVEHRAEYGRVLRFYFGSERYIEVRLFPGGQNILAVTEDKSIAWLKPQELQPAPAAGGEGEPWDWQKISLDWLAAREAKKMSVGTRSTDAAKLLEQKRQKLEKALTKIAVDLERRRAEPWAELGQWIREQQSLDVPTQWLPLIDKEKSLGWNLEHCFQKAKENKIKIAGAQARQAELQAELAALTEVSVVEGAFRPAAAPPAADSLLKSSSAKGRTFEMDGGIRLYVGKSATDNLKLLRQARPWYFWLHLRDEPSAHAILTRNKNQNISDKILHLAAQHLIATTYGERGQRYWGQKMPVLYAECRFVKPIKGDRPGRVTYSHEQSFVHLFSGPEKT